MQIQVESREVQQREDQDSLGIAPPGLRMQPLTTPRGPTALGMATGIEISITGRQHNCASTLIHRLICREHEYSA